jgi:hypothetical protein
MADDAALIRPTHCIIDATENTVGRINKVSSATGIANGPTGILL